VATATDDKARDKAAKAKQKEKAAKAQEKERAAKAKEKEKAAKAKEKDKAAKQKEKERAAKAKEKDKAAKQKEKDKAAKAKEKEKAAKQKEKEKAAKAKDKERAAKAKDKAKDKAAGPKGRGGSTGPGRQRPSRDGSPAPTVHENGWIAEELGRGGAVTRSTKRPSLAASFTTRDHDVIQRWAESRGGVPADVRGTGDGDGSDGGAGVLRIEFRDPGDRLEDVSWDTFFATFDRSDVDFLYQEFTKDGAESRFHKIVRADA
jgi:hypothetical protein